MSSSFHLAIDIGASGGRHILGWLENGALCTEEVHRFPNGMIQSGDQLRWDVEALFDEILTGLCKCKEIGKIPASVGVDTWGVDFALLDDDGVRVAPIVAYRDERTENMDIETYKHISEAELYERTGIQKMPFNTIFQLMAIKSQTPEYFENAKHLLFMPDYLHYMLSGVMKTEYTIASTSGLLNAAYKTWDEEIIRRCGFPRELFGEIVPAGTALGNFTDEIQQAVGFDCKVIMPPSHDTASAFLAVPAKSDKAVYISSGTWSLLGVESATPITSQESRIADFTNEGGYDYRYRYLKNIMGLWILQSVHKEIGGGVTFADMVVLARESNFDGLVDVNDKRFFAPDSMVDTIKIVCRESGHDVPQSIGDFARLIYRSLAVSYANTIGVLAGLTGVEFDSVNIIGGGSQNWYLNELTALACGLRVFAGPAEGTALGSIVAQMISMGVLADSSSARRVIRKSFDIREF